MSAPGRIIRGSHTVTESRIILSEEVKVNIVVNGHEWVNHSIVKKSGDICSCTIFRDPIELNQCDVINFISRTTNDKITNAYVSILIELELQKKALNILWLAINIIYYGINTLPWWHYKILYSVYSYTHMD